MLFLKKNITKRLRNGEPYASTISSQITSAIEVGTNGVVGDYLPAKQDEKGVWTVDLGLVKFVGDLYATGEISAYGKGTAINGDALSATTIEVIDTLTSTNKYAALSANQGRVLNGFISDTYNKAQVDEIIAQSIENVDLSNYYTKEETNYEIANAKPNLTGYATEAWVKEQGYISGYTLPNNIVYDDDLKNYYVKTDIDNKLKGYSLSSHTHSNYSVTGHGHSISDITSLQSTLNGKSNTGHSHAYSEITNTAHTHAISSITNLQSTLDGKFNTSGGTINGDLTVTGKIIANGDISAFGNGSSGNAGGGSIEVVDTLTSTSKTSALSANQGRVLNGLIANTYTKSQIDTLIQTNTPDVDLSNYYTKSDVYNKSEVDNKISNAKPNLTGYATETWVKEQGYISGYTLPNNIVYDDDLKNYYVKTDIDNKLKGYSLSSHTHSNYSVTGHGHSISDITSLQSTLNGKSNTGHSHAYSEITNTAHTHAISSITNLQSTLDGKFNTSGGTINGDLTVTGKIIANGDISAFGNGSSGNAGGGSIEVVDTLTSTSKTSALSANQGRVLNGLIANTYTKSQVDTLIQTNTPDVDLTDYYTKSQVNELLENGITGVDFSNYYNKSQIDTKFGGYSVTSHTHSNYSVTGHGHSISDITSLQSTLDGKSATSHTHSNYSLTSHTHSNYVQKSGDTISGNLTVSGNIVASGEITALSDARVKHNIITLENRGKLNPVTYNKDGKQCIGFIAQDVNELYPELVIESDGFLTLNYSQLTAVLSAQINELYKVVDKLKNEIKELKNK